MTETAAQQASTEAANQEPQPELPPESATGPEPQSEPAVEKVRAYVVPAAAMVEDRDLSDRPEDLMSTNPYVYISEKARLIRYEWLRARSLPELRHMSSWMEQGHPQFQGFLAGERQIVEGLWRGGARTRPSPWPTTLPKEF